MEKQWLNAGDLDFGASQSLSFNKFSDALPTSAIRLYIDHTLTSTTTPTAYSAEHPATVVSEFELTVNGKSRGTIFGYDLWNMMRKWQRVEPQKTVTTYADSTALTIDFCLILELMNPIPPGIPFGVRVKTGSIAEQVDSAGSTAWTSCKIYAQQEVMVHNPRIQQDRENLKGILDSVACDAFDGSTHTLSGTPTTDFDMKELAFKDLISRMFLRVRNNSALANTLVTDFALKHLNQLKKTWKAEELASDYTRYAGMAKPTGIYLIDFDPDNDADGYLSVKQGQQFAIGVKHSTVTGVGDLRIVAQKSQLLYG